MCRFQGQELTPKSHDTLVAHSQRGLLVSSTNVGATVCRMLGLISTRSRKAKHHSMSM